MTVLPDREIFTVGHSTRSLDEFLKLLHDNGVQCLIDVRTAPASRRRPHFAKESLATALPVRGIEYVHESDLGGWRKPVTGSPNTGWEVKGFQGYADHMASESFERALRHVERLAGKRRSALMCAWPRNLDQ